MLQYLIIMPTTQIALHNYNPRQHPGEVRYGVFVIDHIEPAGGTDLFYVTTCGGTRSIMMGSVTITIQTPPPPQ